MHTPHQDAGSGVMHTSTRANGKKTHLYYSTFGKSADGLWGEGRGQRDDLMDWPPPDRPVTLADAPRPPPGLFDDPEDLDAYRAGVAAFNGGDHYRAHDHFEALWGEDFWKGLVQAAVALHHHRSRNPKGIEGLPGNVARILGPYRPHYAGIDVDRFLTAFHAYFQRVESGEDPPLDEAPRLEAAPADEP